MCFLFLVFWLGGEAIRGYLWASGPSALLRKEPSGIEGKENAMRQSCGWCGKMFTDTEVAEHNHLIFHPRCLSIYIDYCKLIKSLCEKEMGGKYGVSHLP